MERIERVITQMIPADGWVAEYEHDDGTIFTEKLVCWVLRNDNKIVGMVTRINIKFECEIVLATTAGNFHQYKYIGNKEVI